MEVFEGEDLSDLFSVGDTVYYDEVLDTVWECKVQTVGNLLMKLATPSGTKNIKKEDMANVFKSKKEAFKARMSRYSQLIRLHEGQIKQWLVEIARCQSEIHKLGGDDNVPTSPAED